MSESTRALIYRGLLAVLALAVAYGFIADEQQVAAWYRTVADGFDPHIHAVDIGSDRLSASARWQVTEYLAGGDGLTGSELDRQAYRTVAGDWYPYTGRHGFDWQAWNQARRLRDRLRDLTRRIRHLSSTRKRVRRDLGRLS